MKSKTNTTKVSTLSCGIYDMMAILSREKKMMMNLTAAMNGYGLRTLKSSPRET